MFHNVRNIILGLHLYSHCKMLFGHSWNILVSIAVNCYKEYWLSNIIIYYSWRGNGQFHWAGAVCLGWDWQIWHCKGTGIHVKLLVHSCLLWSCMLKSCPSFRTYSYCEFRKYYEVLKTCSLYKNLLNIANIVFFWQGSEDFEYKAVWWWRWEKME